MQRLSIRVVVSGRVQGVGYRAWTDHEARRRGLTGWVRNRRDGSVEAVFSGDVAAVDAMVRACRDGPPAAVVSDVRSEPFAGTVPSSFDLLPTA